MFFRDLQNAPHIAALRVRRANCVPTSRLSRCAFRKHVDNHLNLSVPTMHVRWRMIVGERNKPNAVERSRTHRAILDPNHTLNKR